MRSKQAARAEPQGQMRQQHITALAEYARLESTGLWRSDPKAQRREVAVSFGEATLVIADTAGRPLTHWSLPAVTRLDGGVGTACYSLDGSPDETLEIEEPLMVAAIDRVRASLARREPRPGRLRQTGIATVALALILAGTLWLPGALTRQAEALLTPATRIEIGATLLGHLQRRTGPVCLEPRGVEALDRLALRLFAGQRVQIVVVGAGLTGPLALPGGIVVVPAGVIAGEGAADTGTAPLALAGRIVAAALGPAGQDPLTPILDSIGLSGTLRVLATGAIPPESLAAQAEGLAATAPALPGFDAVIAAFALADLPLSPFAYAVDPTGETVLPLIEADATTAAPQVPVMSDADWLALQGICSI